MKRTKGILVTLLSIVMLTSFAATPVFAKNEPAFVMPDILFLSAPEQQQRRFDINGVFDLWTLSNIVTPIVICTGDSDDLTITLGIKSTLASKDYLDFTLIAAGISLDSAIFDVQSKTTPYTITSVLNIDSTFAAIALVAMITSVTGVIEEAENAFPLEFTITYSLTETAAAAE
jgi:hypothetical protein